MTLYRDVLKKAWQVTWRHKFLWLFGFLASFWGIGSTYEIIYKSLRLPEQKDFLFISIWQDITTNGITWDNIQQLFVNSPVTTIIFVLMAVFSLVLIFALYWLATCGQISLIQGANIAEEKKQQSFKGLFEKSKKYFWRTFGVNLFGKIAILLLLILLSYPVLKPLLGTTFSLVHFVIFLIVFVIIFLAVLACEQVE